MPPPLFCTAPSLSVDFHPLEPLSLSLVLFFIDVCLEWSSRCSTSTSNVDDLRRPVAFHSLTPADAHPRRFTPPPDTMRPFTPTQPRTGEAGPAHSQLEGYVRVYRELQSAWRCGEIRADTSADGQRPSSLALGRRQRAEECRRLQQQRHCWENGQMCRMKREK